MSLTKGKHAFIVCPHVDKHHIHSHIVFNSTTIDCTRKFRNFWRSSFAVHKISNMLCLENGLSVIAEPKPSRVNYGTWMGDDKPPTVRGQLEQIIDTALGQGCYSLIFKRKYSRPTLPDSSGGRRFSISKRW